MLDHTVAHLGAKSRPLFANPNTPADAIDPLALHTAVNNINATIFSALQSYAKQGQLKNKLKDFQDISKQYGWFIAGSSYWSIAWINQEVREAMYSGISYSPKEYTKSELLAMNYGLQDYEAVKKRMLWVNLPFCLFYILRYIV